MATVKDVQDAVDAEKAEVGTKLSELAVEIADLKAQVAAGSAVTPEQLDALKLSVENIFTKEPVQPGVIEPIP